MSERAVTEIASGKMKAALAPALGGAVLSLSLDGRHLLRRAPSPGAVADPRDAACYPCVPWFSRLAGGLDFAGRHYDLAPTLPACDPDHALHGHGWTSPWEVTAQTQDRLVCAFDYAPKPLGFPFPFRAVQEFTLAPARFEIALSVTNTGAGPMPAGLGLHPFFPRGGDAQIDFGGERVRFAGTGMDDTHENWGGAAEIINNGMRLAINSNARFLHLYSPESADFFCAEPVTHSPGGFGEKVLAPDEKLKLFLKIEITSQEQDS
ncbi:hypothetical protein [Hyphococcus luteus]|uniref:Aldose 1-epimerase n=1 Tax=Hyphococcus luteus TaxID=2058213 RepID=A0A2S7JZR2_9PROT|nr:hypothetical protein [Marinicaulis flavus]PQA85696.1 hypothetical protein CW354_22480 [Marinicaulis flavus]